MFGCAHRTLLVKILIDFAVLYPTMASAEAANDDTSVGVSGLHVRHAERLILGRDLKAVSQSMDELFSFDN